MLREHDNAENVVQPGGAIEQAAGKAIQAILGTSQAVSKSGARIAPNSIGAASFFRIPIPIKEVLMSITYSSSSVSGEAAAYGGFADALGGIATIVLAIIGLSGVKPEILVPISTVVFGAALLVQGGAMLSEYAAIETMPEGNVAAGGGLSSLFLVGVGGIVLGVLALLDVHPAILCAAAVIAFGAALMLSSSAVWRLLTAQSVAIRFQSRSPMVRVVASEIAAGSSGLQALTGLAVIVLGILAVAGVLTQPLTLIALLAAGAALLMTGSTLSGTLIGFMRTANTAQMPARTTG